VAETPVASVIILVMDEVDRLISCLGSLVALPEAPPHEIVVVGNGTPVETLAALAHQESLVVVPSPVNLGFAGGCNWGARFARGRHLVFLNDDTEVEAGWLQALVDVAQGEPRVGAVGSRLLAPDGSLQEAGSVLWRDAGTHQVGRGLAPGSSAYGRVRDADYCSGCGLLVTREAWDAVGGFDERYFPAYHEDVDLCLALRAHGFRTVYAPGARVVHYGGASLPDDQRTMVAVRNGRRFIAKWGDALRDFNPPPAGRDRDAAVAAAILRAERRPLSPPQHVAAARHPLPPPTEVEALQVQWRAVQAAQSLRDDLLNQLRRDPTRLERLGRLWRREGAAGVLRRLQTLRQPPHRGTGPSQVALDVQYRRWRSRTEPDGRALRQLADEARSWSAPVSIVLLVPSRPGDEGAVRATLRSLQDQPYKWWRAAAYADPGGRATLGDARITWTPRQPGVHWGSSLLDAARPMPGEYVAVTNPGFRVTRHGLLAVAKALRKAPDGDLMYTDWDEIDTRGRRASPHLAYGWSPELLMGCDQLGGLVLQRLDLLERAGGWQEGDVPAELYAELLRASEHARDPRHLPVVALSRPAGFAQTLPLASRRQCLEAWVSSRDPGARVEMGREPGVTDVRFDLGPPQDVDIVIPTRDRHELLRRCLDSLEVSTYPRRRVVVVDNDSGEAQTLEYLSRLPHRVLTHPGVFNFSAIVNRGVAATTAPYVVLLNNDTVVCTPGWLEAMLEWCGRPGVGAVGARLVFGDGRVQHEGIGIGIGRVAANLDLGWSAVRACSAVTAACMMVRREAWDAVGGFDEGLPVAFNDVDFCLRLWRSGWRVVMTPLAELQHDEGSSRGSLASEDDYRRFSVRWGDEDLLRDAFLGPHVAWPLPLTLRIPSRRSRLGGA
jgi:GT2 family glycosyltransferase